MRIRESRSNDGGNSVKRFHNYGLTGAAGVVIGALVMVMTGAFAAGDHGRDVGLGARHEHGLVVSERAVERQPSG